MFENSEKRDYVRVADSAPLTTETVDARGDGALVGEIPRDPTFVFGSGPTDESRVEYQTILGGVPLCLEGSGMGQRRGGGRRQVLLPASQNTETDTTARGGQGQWASECVCSELGVQPYPIAHSVNHALSQPWELHLHSFSYYCNYKCENCGLNTLLTEFNVCLCQIVYMQSKKFLYPHREISTPEFLARVNSHNRDCIHCYFINPNKIRRCHMNVA